MRMRFLGVGLGFLLTLAGVSIPSITAYADSGGTCYTGCTVTTVPDAPAPVTKATETGDGTADGALAFTGADIGEMTAIGAGALVVGGVLVRRNRRRNRAAA